MDCSFFRLMDLIGKKWTFVILEEIKNNGDEGFNFLLSRVNNISPKMLAQRLRELENLRMISRKISTKAEYRLTKKGNYWYYNLVRIRSDCARCVSVRQECIGCTENMVPA
jgi:DNA-binding HxlR family transcriptional regulator